MLLNFHCNLQNLHEVISELVKNIFHGFQFKFDYYKNIPVALF